jgi:uncharacterized membrane protein YphA (DoxX/SURF4 family)
MPTNVGVKRPGGGPGPAYGLAILRILLGVFFLFQGISKIRWLIDSRPLGAQLAQFMSTATPLNRWYLERLLPGLPVFARLVVFGELLTGLALMTGFWTRMVAGLALLMVLNFHVAGGTLFQYAFLTNGYGLPVLGSLLALAIGGGRLPWSLRK